MDANTTGWLHALLSTDVATAPRQLRSDQDGNVRGAGGHTALHVAAEFGDTPSPSQIHDANAEPTWGAVRENAFAGVEQANRQLIEAARGGDLAIVRGLVEREGASVYSTDVTTDETAFSAALAGKWHYVCEYLLEKGAKADGACVVDGKAQSCILTAVTQGSVNFVRRLLDRGAELTLSKYFRRTCPLTEAVLHGTFEMMDVLLDAGIQFNIQLNALTGSPVFSQYVFYALRAEDFTGDDKLVWQRLGFACWRQDMKRIKYLFATYEVLQDREMVAAHGVHALFIALFKQSEEIVAELLARGADVNAHMVKSGATAMAAAVVVDSVRMVQFLLDRGGDFRIVMASHQSSKYGRSFLYFAVNVGSMECARFLLPMEIPAEECDRVLVLAIQWRHTDLVQQLLDFALPSTVDVIEACGRDIYCPLMLDLLLSRCCGERYSVNSLASRFQACCLYSEIDLLTVFFAHGIDVNCPELLNNVLRHAVNAFTVIKPEVLKCLIDGGVNVYEEFADGSTALNFVERALRSDGRDPDSRQQIEACRDILLGITSR